MAPVIFLELLGEARHLLLGRELTRGWAYPNFGQRFICDRGVSH